MTWQTEITPLVRSLISDDISPYTYEDSRLEGIIVSAAAFVNIDVNFENDYTIDVSNSSISPDPDGLGDYNFMNLTAMKSACIISMSEYKTYAMSSMKVVDGPSSIDMSNVSKDFKDRAKGICEAYDNAKLQHQLGTGLGGGHIITTPRTVESIAGGW